MIRCPVCSDGLPTNANFCGKCGCSLYNRTGSIERILNIQMIEKASPVIMSNNLTFKRSALVNLNEQKQSMRNKQPSFRITIFLMICLIVGLGTYIVSTYFSNPAFGNARVPSVEESVQPTLSLQGAPSATVKQGQTLILHGGQFRSNDPIIFLLDFALPIKDKSNHNISVRASSKGSFNVSIPILGSNWSVQTHSIQGIDTITKQNAYLTIVVNSANGPMSKSQELSLSVQDKAVEALTFQAVAGHGNPDQQRVTLTNSSGAPLYWTATANADHDLSWLVIDDKHLAGRLDISGTDSIGISALIAALKSNQQEHPYTGQIVFTINGQNQLALPVELQVADAQSEVVFAPNPAVAMLGPGNTCQATTLTLFNVGQAFISWTLVPYETDTQNHIQFLVNGQSVTQGMLASSGTPGDTVVLNLQCNSVLAGNSYQFTIYAGNTNWLVTIMIQA